MYGKHTNQKEEASWLAAMAYRSSVFVHEGQEAGGKQLIVKKEREKNLEKNKQLSKQKQTWEAEELG